MADISMCSDKMCPLYTRCYRAQAKPNEYRQSMGAYKWNYGCYDYIPMEDKWPDRQAQRLDVEDAGLKLSSSPLLRTNYEVEAGSGHQYTTHFYE